MSKRFHEFAYMNTQVQILPRCFSLILRVSFCPSPKQMQGQRYIECLHDRLFREEVSSLRLNHSPRQRHIKFLQMNRSRYRALAWLEKNLPSRVEYMRSLLQHGLDLTRTLERARSIDTVRCPSSGRPH